MKCLVMLCVLVVVVTARPAKKDKSRHMLEGFLRLLADVVDEDTQVEGRSNNQDDAEMLRLIYMGKVRKGIIEVYPQVDTSQDTCYNDQNGDDCWFRMKAFDSSGTVEATTWLVKGERTDWDFSDGTYEVEGCRVNGDGSNDELYSSCSTKYCTVSGTTSSTCSSNPPSGWSNNLSRKRSRSRHA